MNIGVVVIGRNEGERLINCFKAIDRNLPVVYVDSGSIDGSVNAAKSLGATVVSLDLSIPFTAARARNEGWRKLLADNPIVDFIQFIDGDCELLAGWFESASNFLAANPNCAVACGRRTERFPERTVYNRLCDIEWNTAIGEAKACGGDALIRASVLIEVNGYRDDVIAGEEPEMCIRIRALGYKVFRLNVQMTLDDANIQYFSQWWKRSVRCGFAYAQGVFLHGGKPEWHWLKEGLRALFWGGFLPSIIAISVLLGFLWCAVILIGFYILSFVKTALSQKNADIMAIRWQWSGFMLLSKFSEFLGAIKFLTLKLSRKNAKIIEYK